ncbi:hypothetical protein WMY93_011928 [Mugilogobius chulae]|uniref:Uncharacterized protein n=1 Tax=Mugilogobius chulae TaxID=88201 RepID=A0AAW0P3G2_9GOBI
MQSGRSLNERDDTRKWDRHRSQPLHHSSSSSSSTWLSVAIEKDGVLLLFLEWLIDPVVLCSSISRLQWPTLQLLSCPVRSHRSGPQLPACCRVLALSSTHELYWRGKGHFRIG